MDRRRLKIILSRFWIQSKMLTDLQILQLQRIAVSFILWARIIIKFWIVDLNAHFLSILIVIRILAYTYEICVLQIHIYYNLKQHTIFLD